MSEKNLTLQYENNQSLFRVYGTEDKSIYILDAVFPGVGWEACTIVLNEREMQLLREDEEQFSKFVAEFTNNRKSKKYTNRRIESLVEKKPPYDTLIYKPRSDNKENITNQATLRDDPLGES
jgi:pyruvate dehydrogenase complex dehydrogenase (E1) component